MPASNICWGIELGAGSIKALKLQRDGEDLKVLEFANIPHKKVLSTPDLDQNEATRVAIGQLVSQYDLSGAGIAISVPGHSAFARFAKLPPVEPKKIPDIVKFEAVQQIPFPIEQVEWDYQTFTSQDSPDVEVGIFAITRDRIMERLAMWNDVGVTPDFVTIGPLAVYNALAWDQQFDARTPGTVILDVGTTSTDLIVCEPGRLWIRTFPIGGHQFTQALVDAFKLSYTKAEALKLQAEQSKHARHVFQALRPVFGDLAQDVQRSIGYYQSSHKDANLTRLIGLGSTFNLPGLRKYLSQQLQMEVVRLEQFNRLSLDGPAAGEFQAATLNLATAYGLALQGLGFDHGVMVNLMPVPVVREALWSRKTKWFAVAAGLSLAAGGLSFIKPIQSRPVVEKKAPLEVEETKRIVRALKAEWTEVSSKFAPDFKAANAADLLKHRDVHPHLVNDLALILANADSKRGDKPGLVFTEFKTDYLAPAADAPPPVSPPPPAGGTAAPAIPPLPTGTGRVTIELDVQTIRGEDSGRFLEQTVNKWLLDHQYRPGVPYMVDKSSIRYDKERIQVAADPNAPQSAPADPSSGGSAPSAGKGPRMGGAGARSAPSDRRAPAAGSQGSPGSSWGGGSGAAAQAVDQLAPLPPPPPEAPPGSTLFKFKVYWDVVIMPEIKPENKS
jgi:type IV pilus assembly protein PilM